MMLAPALYSALLPLFAQSPTPISSALPDISLIGDFGLAASSAGADLGTLQSGAHDPHRTGFNIQAI